MEVKWHKNHCHSSFENNYDVFEWSTSKLIMLHIVGWQTQSILTYYTLALLSLQLLASCRSLRHCFPPSD